MKDLFTVASFTLKEMVKKKSFIISNIIFLIIILIGTNVPRIMEKFNGSNDGRKVLIVDSKNVFKGSLDYLVSENSSYDITISNENHDKERIKDFLENGDYEEVIVLDVNEQNLIFNDYQEEATLMSVPPDDLMKMITDLYYGIRLANLHLSTEELNSLHFNTELNMVYIKENTSGNSFILCGILLCESSFCFCYNGKDF